MILWAMVVVAAACVFSLLLLIVAAERTLERLERENRLLRERIAEAGSAARRWEPASPISVRPKLRLTKLDEKSASESRKRAREIIEAHAKQRGG